ncbi:MAG: hypothetical protein Q4E35_01490 [Eubacteriales bacterium]|nr:hypothetical protein [Eubacteriales bacterium]
MKNSKKKKIGSLFYWLFLLLYSAALIGICVIALKVAWNFAEKYELSMPDDIISSYVDGLQGNILDGAVMDTIKAMPHAFQSDEEVAQIVTDMFSGRIEYAEGESESPDIKVYYLICDGYSFGKVYLMKDQSKSPYFSAYGYEIKLPYDLRPWLFYKEEFDFSGLYSGIEVTVPNNYHVMLNGRQFTSDYIVEDNIKMDCLSDYYDICAGLPVKVKYRYENIIGKLEPVIYDEAGDVYTIDTTRDDSQFLKPCAPEKLARLDEFCGQFSQNYLRYISGVYGEPSVGYYNLQPYLLAGSDLDERMINNQDGLGWAHTSSFNLDSYSLTNAIELGDGFFVCYITADSTTYTTGKGEQKTTSNLKLLVLDDGNSIKAVSMI